MLKGFKSFTILQGQDRDVTIIDAYGKGSVISIWKDYVRISGFTIRGGGKGWNAGIWMEEVNNCMVSNNKIADNRGISIYLEESSNNIFSDNIITNNSGGIYFMLFSENNTLSNSVITDNVGQIGVYYSKNNTISNNKLSNDPWYFVYLYYSDNNRIFKNDFARGGLFVIESHNNIVKNNIVNGKPLIYLEKKSSIKIKNAGQVILIDCSDIRIENLKILNTIIGVELWNTSNCVLRSNKIYDGGWLFFYSEKNRVSDNIFVNGGLSIYFSFHNIMKRNTVNGRPLVYLEKKTNLEIKNAGQIILVNCSNMKMENLDLSNTDVGIELWDSTNCEIKSSKLINNRWAGMISSCSNHCIISNNNFSNNRVGMRLYKSGNIRIIDNIIANNRIGIDSYDISDQIV